MAVAGTINTWDRVVSGADRLGKLLSSLTLKVCAVFIGVMTVVVVTGVFCRYLLRYPLGWSEELARYLMIWGALLAVGPAIQSREHVAISFVVERLPISVARLVVIGLKVIILLFLLVLVQRGWLMAVKGTAQLAMSLGISMLWPLMAVPVSGAIAVIHLVIQIIVDTRLGTVKDLMGILSAEELARIEQGRTAG